MNRLRAPVLRHRIFQLAADAVLAAIAFYLAFAIRFIDEPGGIPDRYMTMITGSIVFVALGKTAIFGLMGLHQKWWRYFNLGDIWSVMRACAVASALLIAIFVIAKPFSSPMPRSVMIFDFVFTLGLLVVARSIARFYFVERRMRSHKRRKHDDVLVVGAGSGGQMVVRELRLNPELGNPVGFVDDDPRKRGMRLSGLKVLGGTDELGAILEREKPAEVVIAIPSAPCDVRGKVVSACRERDIRVRTLPTVFELLRGGVQLTRQLREVQVEDVLGRDPVVIELDRVGAYLRDKVVLVTGAGGSIGSELCRQVSRLGPTKLVLVDHSEPALFEIERELVRDRGFTAAAAIVADVKDGVKLRQVFEKYRPGVVFHAAAYKHVAMMEANPLEAVRNNTLGTRTLADVAVEFGARRFVLVSTDKAANPRTVMGQSKALCEWIVETYGHRSDVPTRFVAVRFGNVLGSSGSVIPIFRKQIARGGPVTVTHAEMTRFFMTIPEAVQLVVQAGAIGERGQVYVLDMGEPVRILDLAEKMIRLSGKEPGVDVPIEFIGPAPGEKLHEVLVGDGETVSDSTHPKIQRITRPPVEPTWLDESLLRLERLVEDGETLELVGALNQVVSDPRRAEAAVQEVVQP